METNTTHHNSGIDPACRCPNGLPQRLGAFFSATTSSRALERSRVSPFVLRGTIREIDVDSRGHRVWRLERDRSGDLRDLIEGKRFDAVVVKCLGQGTVSEELVTLIGAAVGKVPWFVSSVLGTAGYVVTIHSQELSPTSVSPPPLLSKSRVWQRGELPPGRFHWGCPVPC